jgi:hypothetical protein
MTNEGGESGERMGCFFVGGSEDCFAKGLLREGGNCDRLKSKDIHLGTLPPLVAWGNLGGLGW